MSFLKPPRQRPRASSPDGFYGWRIVTLSSIALVMTAPGQTAAISVFIDPMVNDLGISRSLISTAYLVGTLGGALCMPLIGRLFDRHGARLTMAFVGAGFGAMLFVLAATTGPAHLTLGFAGVRMFGQGALGLAATTVTALWFVQRRGSVLGLVAAIGAAGISLAPVLLEPFISAHGWRTAWAVEGALVWAIVIPLAIWGFKDHPADLGQEADGAHRDSNRPAAVEEWGLTRKQALRTPFFWLISSAVAVSGALATAVAFHQISLLGERGLSTIQAAANFLPQTAASLVATLITGTLADRISTRWVTVGCMASLSAGLLAGTVVSPGWSAIGFGILIGAAGGSIRTLEAATFPRFFGTQHLGSIRGLVTAIGVGSTALGPVAFALVHDRTHSYIPALYAGAVLPLAVAIAALFVAAPVTNHPSNNVTAA